MPNSLSKNDQTANLGLFSTTSFNACWSSPADLWVILNPEENPWVDQMDGTLNLIIRRTYLRFETQDGGRGKRSRDENEPILIAATPGHPAARILLLCNQVESETGWLHTLEPIVRSLGPTIRRVTVFPPSAWRVPMSKTILNERPSDSKWELRWVE